MKNIIVLADFPPVIGGTTIWYYRICELLMQRGYRLFSLGGGGTPPPGVLNLNPTREKSAVKRLVCFILDVVIEATRQRRVLGEIIHAGILQPQETGKIISYLLLIRRVIHRIPAEEGIVFAAHANINSVLAYMLCRRHGRLRMVIRSHGACVLEYAAKNPCSVRFVLKKADRINCVSRFIADKCIGRGAAAAKVRVIHSARDIPDAAPDIAKENIVLFCGFLDPRKDPLTFLMAVKKLVASGEGKNIRFVMVGDGSLKEKLRDFCRLHGLQSAVTFTGVLPIEKVWEWMKKSKVLVLPSIREPSGAVLTEAMAYRCYCIAARVGGIPELVTPGRGSLFEASDDTALADHIRDYFAHEERYREKIQAAYEYVRANYTFERAADQLEEQFKEIQP